MKKLKILIVDDAPEVRKALASIFVLRGHRVATAGGASEALGKLDEDLDVIISDFEMDDTDGAKLLETVQASRPGMPSILMTGADLGRARRALAASNVCATLMAKPFSLEEVEAAVEACLLEARARGAEHARRPTSG